MKKYVLGGTLVIIGFFLLVNLLLNINRIPSKKVLKEELTKYVINEEEKDLQKNEKWFVNMEILGTKKAQNNVYVYALVEGDSYYLRDNQKIKESGFLIPYRFTINYQNNNVVVVKYEIPKDGLDYEKDIKELFPWRVRIKLNGNYKLQEKNDKEADEYFKINL